MLKYNKEVCRLITGEAKAQLARGMIEFSKLWMKFVRERCERGRGLRPRWANQGLDFLMTACEPDKTKFLSDQEFEVSKAEICFCFSSALNDHQTQLLSLYVFRDTENNLSIHFRNWQQFPSYVKYMN